MPPDDDDAVPRVFRARRARPSVRRLDDERHRRSRLDVTPGARERAPFLLALEPFVAARGRARPPTVARRSPLVVHDVRAPAQGVEELERGPNRVPGRSRRARRIHLAARAQRVDAVGVDRRAVGVEGGVHEVGVGRGGLLLGGELEAGAGGEARARGRARVRERGRQRRVGVGVGVGVGARARRARRASVDAASARRRRRCRRATRASLGVARR